MRPQDMDLNKAIYVDEEGIVALVEGVRRTGAKSVQIGYRGVGENYDEEPDPNGPVTWFCEAKYIYGRGKWRRTRTITKERVANPGGGETGAVAQAEAIADVIR